MSKHGKSGAWHERHIAPYVTGATWTVNVATALGHSKLAA